MQKIRYLVVLLFLTACGQTPTTKIDPNIKNSRTDKHIHIPGTRLYMIPPPGFKVSSTFIGLQKGESAIINIYDLVGGNINTNAATFSQAEFERQGAKVFEFKEISVNDFPAKYIQMQGDPAAKGQSLVFGDTTFTTMIMTSYPAADEKTGNDIIQSLNTIYYDKSKKIDPFEAANFSIDDNASKFKFSQYAANVYVYTIGGVNSEEDKDAPVVLISQYPKEETMTGKSLTDMLVNKIQQNGITIHGRKNTFAGKINGYDAYQTELYGQMQGNYSLLYYCVLIKGDKVITIQGTSKNNMAANLEEFKKMAKAVKIK